MALAKRSRTRDYRYYVLPAKDGQSGSATRIPATKLERIVRANLAEILSDPFILLGKANGQGSHQSKE